MRDKLPLLFFGFGRLASTGRLRTDQTFSSVSDGGNQTADGRVRQAQKAEECSGIVQ